jgi:hypothetical protein
MTLHGKAIGRPPGSQTVEAVPLHDNLVNCNNNRSSK